MEQLKFKTGMPGVMIPYKSSNEMVLSVLEGQTMMTIVDPPPSVPQVIAGKVKALAVTGNQRSPQLPDVPSMAEAGFPGVDVQLWSGMFAPIATPAPVVAKLEAAFNAAIHDSGVSAKLQAMAVIPGGGSPDEFKRMIDADIAKYSDLIKAANLHFED
jgi:tripartite-type tricarboxylate transporter receptor subunit TctC